MARADTLTISVKQPEIFSDFLVNFDRNPVTGLLARVINEDSIKQALKMSILTVPGERFYDPLFGSKVRASLFDPMGKTTEDIIKFTIETTIKREPRIREVAVVVKPDYDNNTYEVAIAFKVVNFSGKQFFASITLNQLR